MIDGQITYLTVAKLLRSSSAIAFQFRSLNPGYRLSMRPIAILRSLLMGLFFLASQACFLGAPGMLCINCSDVCCNGKSAGNDEELRYEGEKRTGMFKEEPMIGCASTYFFRDAVVTL